jgi:adenylate cyclase
MFLRITTNYQGTESLREFDADRLLIGRPDGAEKTGLDLSPDACVSRQHAVLQVKDGVCWLADLGSKFGTQVNGREIRNQGDWRLWPEDTIVVGETTLRIACLPGAQAVAANVTVPLAASGGLRIVRMIDTDGPLVFPHGAATSTAERRLTMLLDLPRQFSAQTGLNDLLQTVMNRVVEVIPAARRGALLMHGAERDALLLKAYVSADEPAVSETLARRALAEKRGFIWRSGTGDTTRSMREFHIVSGMYAPLQWQDQVFGVVCVDSPVAADAFHEDDLQFLIAIGQYAGMALAQMQLVSEQRQNAKLVGRLMANFSPKVRDVLMEQARRGKLRPGGTKSEVTVLFCDICGFTQSAAQMDAHDVVDMLNQYFQPLIEAILNHDGTVDKFVGDAILAVFGSPQADPQQHEKAVRAALGIQQAVQATSQLRAARSDVTCQVRVGVHSGEVFHGFVGSAERLEFTVIGDAVNRASRFCDGAQGGEIIISPEVYERVFKLVRADKTTIATKNEGDMTAYRVRAIKE